MEKKLSVNEKEKNKKRGALIVILILILSILLGSGIWIYRKSQNTSNDANSGIVSWNKVNAEDFDEYLKRVQQEADDSMFSVEMNSSPKMVSGDSEANLMIQNKPSNKFNMIVKITETSTGDVLYTSGTIKPNQHIETGKLNKKLPKGKHPATALFQAINPQNNNVAQNVNVDVVFNVES